MAHAATQVMSGDAAAVMLAFQLHPSETEKEPREPLGAIIESREA
jgi:hypothetical protein